MNRSKFFFLLTIMQLFVISGFGDKPHRYNICSSGSDRQFYIELPSKITGKLPILLVFHGGGGTALNAMRHYGFKEPARQKGYIAVYPQGLNKQWYDGRLAPAKGEIFDDVQFIKDLLHVLPSICPEADTSRVFSTGISNGGFFSIYLAARLNNIIDGIAPVCASIPKELENIYLLQKPIPMMLIAGTNDPLVKYDGGWVGFGTKDSGRGYAMPMEWTLNKWLEITSTVSIPTTIVIPDADPSDGCKAVKYDYSRNAGTFVTFIKIEGGGHTWPGGKQYLPNSWVGNVCRDFDAAKTIVAFFDNFK